MRVITKARVYTMAESAIADAIAWRGDRIVAVGREADVLRAAGPGAEVQELPGRAVVPGFIDAHHHLSIAVLFSCGLELGPEHAKTHDEIAAKFARHAADLPRGAWVVGYGYDEW